MVAMMHPLLTRGGIRLRAAAGGRLDRATVAPIFVVGSPHSGTSIVLKLLDAHTRIEAIEGETDLFAAAVGYKRCLALIRKFGRFEKDTARRKAEKTPRHVFHIPEILSVFPRARIVVTIRDGRDVYCSLRRRGLERQRAVEVWLEHTHAGLGQGYHPAVRSIRYEDLVGDPVPVLQELFAFLGEAYEPEVLDHHRQVRSWYAASPDKPASAQGQENHAQLRTWQINQPLFNASGRWREALVPEDLAVLDGRFQEMLERLGYETGDHWRDVVGVCPS